MIYDMLSTEAVNFHKSLEIPPAGFSWQINQKLSSVMQLLARGAKIHINCNALNYVGGSEKKEEDLAVESNDCKSGIMREVPTRRAVAFICNCSSVTRNSNYTI